MVVDSLFLIAPDVCGFLCLVPVFVMQYLMSFLVFFHCGRESWLLYFNCVLTVL